MKHAGQKSVKEELPERRKGPKRAIECRLKVPTHIWEKSHEGSNPSRCAKTPLKHMCFKGVFFRQPERAETRNAAGGSVCAAGQPLPA